MLTSVNEMKNCRIILDGDSGIFGKNPSAPLQESNLFGRSTTEL